MTKRIKVGKTYIGGGEPITVQSMCNIPFSRLDELKAQSLRLQAAGCEILRASFPSPEDAAGFYELKNILSIPLVADIHFDYKAALAAVEAGADKIRINPGNMGAENIKKVVSACKKKGIPIRVGINSGSVEKRLLEKYGGASAEALYESAADNVRLLLDNDFEDIVISMKSSSVPISVKAYRLMAASELSRFPLHIGVTEAGTLGSGIIKSAAGMGALLVDGIGDTLRFSLTADPVEEIYAAVRLLKALGIRKEGIELISCPTCGRTTANTMELADYIEKNYSDVKKYIKIAVMGCVVNGPGEAADAELGVTGVNGKYVLFKKGKVYMKDISESDIKNVLDGEIRSLLD